jgi:2-polyprenyl-3-methyl-5-hydroxy-6-metoxy-1,4-benzoquinol methylase
MRMQQTEIDNESATGMRLAGPCCLFCGTGLEHTFVDLGLSPLCESYVSRETLQSMEAFYPLHVFVCHKCYLVQLPVHVDPTHIFSEYAYFSSYSSSWVEHARAYVEEMVPALGLDRHSLVVELASNDGYLLQHLVGKGIPVLGVEPAANVAKEAERREVPTIVDFFGTRLARDMAAEGKHANLVIGNNVLAQVPEINDFVEGIRTILKPRGVVTMEFPHLMHLVDEVQFDTIYHEHFSYFSFTTVEAIFRSHGLTIFDVKEIPTHGGSLRIYARHADDESRSITGRVSDLLSREERRGMHRLGYYASFSERVMEVKRSLLEFLIQARREGKSIAGYGAPGKGNTLLNYCGIRTDFIEYTVDRNPYKQGKFLPGTRIPILEPSAIAERRPDYLLILPWNLKDEIVTQMSFIREWGGRFIVPIPTLQVIS